MKAEIISMQRVYNHGSFLQAYGLKKMIGYYVEDVRFGEIIPGIQNEEIQEHFVESNNIPFFYKYKIRILERMQKRVLMKAQKEILKVDYHFNNHEYKDIAFIGSDEMFNCLAPSQWGVSPQLFGDVPNCNHANTYAVSCGHTTIEKIPTKLKSVLKSALDKLDYVSVRDENTANFVQELLNITPQFHLDPVLIYDYKDEVSKKKKKKKYLLVYSYSNRICNMKEITSIKSFAKKRGLITIGVGVFQYWCDKNIVVHPFELLSYFKNASYIVTDTFHGAVLSIKYNREFVTFVRKSNKYKLYDLLARLKQESRIVEEIDQFNNIASIKVDYSLTNSIIDKEKRHSMTYIKQCIEESRADD